MPRFLKAQLLLILQRAHAGDGAKVLAECQRAHVGMHAITTIEGLGTARNLHPMQAAFVKHDGYQCGFCTPGQICSAVAMLDAMKAGIPSHVTADLRRRPQPSAAEFRERMSGNICRCGAYSNRQEAIAEVAGARS